MTTSLGDVAAALEFAERCTLEDTIDLGDGRRLVRHRPGETWENHDTGQIYAPRRANGTVHVHDAASFVAAVAQRGKAVVYADEERLALVAVLNDDLDGEPGWRDYRVSLELRPTEEWKAWKAGQGPRSQEAFATRIEDGLPEIVDPPGATMLELAQTFHATVGTTIKAGHRLANGQRQLVYEEDVQASAGATAGTISIPETFTLGVAPFIGSEAYGIEARLRFEVPRREGEFKIGYTLVRPDAIERDAFNAVVTQTREEMNGTSFLAGPAPSAARGT